MFHLSGNKAENILRYFAEMFFYYKFVVIINLKIQKYEEVHFIRDSHNDECFGG